MAIKSVVTEAKQIHLAVELIKLGARLQVLEAETTMSRERLLKLYKEVNGYSPPKGMLPYGSGAKLEPEQLLQVASYVLSRRGSNPATRSRSRAA